MPTGATGTTISLVAQYPEAPTTPLVDVIDPDAVTVVSSGVPYAIGGLRYQYDFAVPAAGPAGTWTIDWYGITDGEELGPVTNTFTVTQSTITFPSTECPSSPMWITAEDYVGAHSKSSLSEAEDAVMEATWLLWALTGKQYHGIECRLDEYQSRPGLCRMRLAHQPVDEVLTVVRVDDCTGEETEVDDWCSLSGGYVRLCCSGSGGYLGLNAVMDGPTVPWSCRCDNGIVRVQYRVQSNLPPGYARVTDKLADEFWKAAHGQKCNLPERITNVTREGTTWVTLDPLDFLDKGLTGIGSIDQWISGVNLRGNATLTDPLTQPRLLTSEVTGCGETCGAAPDMVIVGGMAGEDD